MNRRLWLRILIVLVIVGAVIAPAAAQVPLQINYQGVLTDAGGSPVPDGEYLMIFAIYDTSSGGVRLWSETQTVPVAGGVYNVTLGQPGNEIPPVDMDGDRYLGVTVESDAEMTPRQPLTSTAFSLRAAISDNTDALDGMDSADFAARDHGHGFADLTGTATDAQIPDTITIDHAATAGDADTVDGQHADAFAAASHSHDSTYFTEQELSQSEGGGQVHWDNLTGVPGGFADGTDNDSGGDITGVTPGVGLSGGGYSGQVTLDVTIPLVLSGSNYKYGIVHSTNADATMPGVFGKNSASGNTGSLGTGTAGVRGYHAGSGNTGHLGTAGYGVWGASAGGIAGYFDSTSGYGLVVNRGNAGIGTSTPTEKLEVNGSLRTTADASGKLYVGRYSSSTPNAYISAAGGASTLRFQIGDSTKMTVESSGDVGIGTSAPTEKLHVAGTLLVEESGGADVLKTLSSVVRVGALAGGNDVDFEVMDPSIGDEALRFNASAAALYLGSGNTTTAGDDGDLFVYDSAGLTTIHLDGATGRTTTKILQITGGSDLSEGFEITANGENIRPQPGLLVSIDPENPGGLAVSSTAYDRRVAGIISGAGGINPGMVMGQQGSGADGPHPVALSGRVYCWADASTQEIIPGDLLTSSDLPGHAMKISDYTRAQGAIIGKAMTPLKKGKGLVLVLVSLQ